VYKVATTYGCGGAYCMVGWFLFIFPVYLFGIKKQRRHANTCHGYRLLFLFFFLFFFLYLWCYSQVQPKVALPLRMVLKYFWFVLSFKNKSWNNLYLYLYLSFPTHFWMPFRFCSYKILCNLIPN